MGEKALGVADMKHPGALHCSIGAGVMWIRGNYMLQAIGAGLTTTPVPFSPLTPITNGSWKVTMRIKSLS